MESNDIAPEMEVLEDPMDQPNLDVPEESPPLPIEVKTEDKNIIVYISTGTELQKLVVKESECTDLILTHGSSAVVKYINREIVIDKRPRAYNIFGEPLPKISHRFPVPRQGRNIVLSKIIEPARRFPRYVPDVTGHFSKLIYDPYLVELSTEYEAATDEESEDPEEPPDDPEEGFSLSRTFYWVIIWWNDILEFYTTVWRWLSAGGLSLYRYCRSIEPEPEPDGTRGARLTWT